MGIEKHLHGAIRIKQKVGLDILFTCVHRKREFHEQVARFPSSKQEFSYAKTTANRFCLITLSTRMEQDL